MSTRSSTHSVTSSTAPTVSNNLDKENFDPVTGEHAAPIKLVGKKRKTGVLAAKGQPSSKLNAENIDRSQPGNKKRKSSPPPSSAELKTRKHAKGPGSSKTTKLASLKITTSLPRLTEEEEVTRMLMTQEEINSICKELTVKPLADVSEAYDDELNALDSGPSASDVAEERNGVCTVKVRTAIALKRLTYLFSHASHIYSHRPWSLRFVISLSCPPSFPLRHLGVCGLVRQMPQNHAYSQRHNERRSIPPLYSLPLLKIWGELAAVRSLHPLLKNSLRQHSLKINLPYLDQIHTT